MRTSVGTLLSELVSSVGRLSRIALDRSALDRAQPVDGENVSPTAWRTLEVLQESSPKRLGELATIARVTQPTMTGIVAGLVKAGWAVRVTDPSDARAQLIDITPDGGDAVDDWRTRYAAAMEPFVGELSASEIDVIQRAVDIVTKVAEHAQSAPSKRRQAQNAHAH